MPSLSRFWSSFGPLDAVSRMQPWDCKRYGLRSNTSQTSTVSWRIGSFLRSISNPSPNPSKKCHSAAMTPPPPAGYQRRCAETGQHFPLFMCSKCLQKRRRIPFLIEILAFSSHTVQKIGSKAPPRRLLPHRGTKKRGVTDRQKILLGFHLPVCLENFIFYVHSDSFPSFTFKYSNFLRLPRHVTTNLCSHTITIYDPI